MVGLGSDKNVKMNKFVDKCGETCWWHCDEFLFLIVFSTAVERSEKVSEVATAICRLWRQLVTFFDDIAISCKVAMVVIFEIVPLILCQLVKSPRNPSLHLLSTSMNIEQNCGKAQFESSRLSSHLYQVGILSQYLTFGRALRPPGGQSLNWSDKDQRTWQLIIVIFPFWLLLSWQTLKIWSWILTELFLNISFLNVKRSSKRDKMYFLVYPWESCSAEFALPLLWCPMKLVIGKETKSNWRSPSSSEESESGISRPTKKPSFLAWSFFSLELCAYCGNNC